MRKTHKKKLVSLCKLIYIDTNEYKGRVSPPRLLTCHYTGRELASTQCLCYHMHMRMEVHSCIPHALQAPRGRKRKKTWMTAQYSEQTSPQLISESQYANCITPCSALILTSLKTERSPEYPFVPHTEAAASSMLPLSMLAALLAFNENQKCKYTQDLGTPWVYIMIK